MQYATVRRIGVAVLVLGIGSAATLYWLESRSTNIADDPLLTGYSRPEKHQMEALYGTMGTLSDDLLDSLKKPGTQAALIIGISIVISAACFYFGRPANHDPGNP